MLEQLEKWQGPFGQAYTDRNIVDWRTVLPYFREILEGLPVGRMLEVGCNRGHNLVALRELLGKQAEVAGVEPNPHARALASSTGERVIAANIYGLPFPDAHFDLVITAGVLIHVPLEQLPAAMKEVYRCSKRFIVAVEYYAPQETAIKYHGMDNLLWKRDFLSHYLRLFPDLRLARSGYREEWDRSSWWLLEKEPAQ
jgi:pseudaminic acid biosynthesis-associated methylase